MEKKPGRKKVDRSSDLYWIRSTLLMKHRGRKPGSRSLDYKRGYSAGFRRAERKAKGQIPITRKSKDKLRSEDYQAGLKDGLMAGRRFYGSGKTNRGQ